MSICLDDATRIIEEGIAIARGMKLKPLTLCVLDTDGHVVSAQREDGSTMFRFQIAYGKAWGSIGLGHSTRFYEDTLVKARPYFANSLEAASGGRFITVYGGVLIRSQDGELVGAIGVTGDSGANDEKVAVMAIEKCGFKADLS